jgi:hypothetical protein
MENYTIIAEMRAGETSSSARKEIASSKSDRSLEQVLYCAYGYTDAITGCRCEQCNLVNYDRDCHNNLI